MKNFYIIIILVFTYLPLRSQLGKMGINTETPTEILDVQGTGRIRQLPTNVEANSINTKPDGSLSLSKDQTFVAANTIVSDNNGVLGIIQGYPSTSITKTFIAPAGGFPSGSDSNPPYTVSFGTITIGFNQTSNNGFLDFMIKTTSSSDTYVADEREFGGTYKIYKFNGTLSANTWSPVIDYYIIGADSWHINVWLKSLNKIYRVTVIGAKWSGTSTSTTGTGDQFTVNIQQL